MSLDDDLHDTEVFADELQARGDPRGELLTLELAAERGRSRVAICDRWHSASKTTSYLSSTGRS